MNEPSRLLDSTTDDLERELLRAGADYSASPELRGKTLAALGLTGAAATLGASVTASASVSGSGAKLGVSSLLAKLGAAKLAVLAVGATAAVAVPLALQSSAPPAPAVVPPSPAALPAPTPKVSRVVAPPTPAEPAVPQAPAPTASARAASPRPLSSAEALRIELGQLDAARSRLRSGRADEALALLDAYDRVNPRGALKLEAEVLRIDALSRSGRTALAKSRAQAFLARHPQSVLAARVRRLAGQ